MKRQATVKALFGISLLLGLFLMVSGLLAQFTALPNLGKILPEEGTAAFFMLRADLARSVLKENPYVSLPWVEAAGWAQVDGESLIVLEVNSSQEADNYLLSLKAEGEMTTKSYATRSLWSGVTCYPSSDQPCFTWMGNLLILSEDDSLLKTLQKVAAGEESSLQETTNYQNLRSRLAMGSGGFVYVDIQKMLPRYSSDFKTFTPLLALFPSFGVSINPQNGAWYAESFLAVDKTLIDNTAYWHPTQKYAASLWPWTSDTAAVEWGGRDLAAQMIQMENLLQKRSPEAADLFMEELQTRLQNLFGSELSFSNDLAPLLDGEQYFGFTPDTDFLFLTSLDSEEEINKALALKDRFAEQYRAHKTFQTPSGETQARFVPLTETTGKHESYQYYSFTAEDEELATVIVTEELAIVAKKKQTAFDALDRVTGLTALRPVDRWNSILTGSDELLTVHCLLLPDGSILKTLLGEFTTITTARKLFDDGTFARSIVGISATHD